MKNMVQWHNRSYREVLGDVLMALNRANGKKLGVYRLTCESESHSLHLRQYLEILASAELVVIGSSDNIITLTEKGMKAADIFEKLRSLLEIP